MGFNAESVNAFWCVAWGNLVVSIGYGASSWSL